LVDVRKGEKKGSRGRSPPLPGGETGREFSKKNERKKFRQKNSLNPITMTSERKKSTINCSERNCAEEKNVRAKKKWDVEWGLGIN